MNIGQLFSGGSTLLYLVVAEPKLLGLRPSERLNLDRMLELFGPYRSLQYLLIYNGNNEYNAAIFGAMKAIIYQIGALLPSGTSEEVVRRYESWVAAFNYMQLNPTGLTPTVVNIIDSGCDFFINPANGFITEEQLAETLRQQLPASIWD